MGFFGLVCAWDPMTLIGGQPANNVWQGYALVTRAAGMFYLSMLAIGAFSGYAHIRHPKRKPLILASRLHKHRD